MSELYIFYCMSFKTKWVKKSIICLGLLPFKFIHLYSTTALNSGNQEAAVWECTECLITYTCWALAPERLRAQREKSNKGINCFQKFKCLVTKTSQQFIFILLLEKG